MTVQQDQTSVAEVAPLTLVSLSQSTPCPQLGRVTRQSLPTKSFLIFLISFFSKSQVGKGWLQGEMSSYRQQPAFVQKTAILQTKERERHRSW